MRQALQSMLGSAESLKNAQEHAADQLNRIIPFLQERSQGLSEIAQITGKQVAHALQSISASERGLRTSAEQSEVAIRKFSTTADTLGERMFGAVNLLQASGKVLAETTETAQNRFDAAIERIGSATFQMPSAHALPPVSTERLDQAVAALEMAHGKLENILAEQTHTTRAHIELLSTQSSSLLTQASTSSQTLSSAADRLRDEQAKLGELLGKIGTQLETPSVVQQALPVDFAAPILADIREGFGALEQRVSILHNQIATLLSEAEKPKSAPADGADEMRDHWYQMAAQIEATRSNLAQVITQQTDRVEAQIASLAVNPSPVAAIERDFARDAQNQMEQQTLILNELVATLGLLDAHMQELRSQVAATRQKAG